MDHLGWELPDSLFITIRAISSFLFLLLLARLMGKKHVSKLTFFDYIVGITIGNIAADLSSDAHVKTIDGFIGLIIWGIFPILISMINVKSYWFRHITDGRPTILIDDGNILEENLKKQRLTINDLMLMLREKDVFKLNEVQFGILERNGQFSIMRKPDFQPVTPKTAGITVAAEQEPRILIIDGNIMEKTLSRLGYSKLWLVEEIKKQGAFDIQDVFLAQLESTGTIYVDLKQDTLKKHV